MKKLANLKGAKALNKNEQQSINGGGLKSSCYPGTDAICCGTAQWQCGQGWDCGGYFQGYYNGNPVCACV